MSSETVSTVTPGDDRAKFSSTFSTYVTLLGYSLGFSDFWRFPFLVYRNGGGAFLIPFAVTMFACGIPMYFLEYSITKFSGKSPYKIWDMCPIFRGIAYALLVANAIYMIGNTAMRFWVVDYLINSFRDPLPWTTCGNSWNTEGCYNGGFLNSTDSITTTMASVSNSNLSISGNTTTAMPSTTSEKTTAAEEFWLENVLSLSSGITDFDPFAWRHVIALFVWRLIVALLVVKSIKSIEKVMFVTTFVPFILTVAIFIRSLTLPGASDGLYFFFNPDFDKLANSRVWIEASLMAFYTLGLGWGPILLLGSHAHFNENCYRTAIVLPVLDGIMATFYGMICFSVLGNTAVAYNMDLQEIIKTGMSTGIVAYTSALSTLPLPQLWSVFFFTSTILSGFDSQMVNTELSIQIIGDSFPSIYPKYRLHMVFIFAFVMFLGCLPLCTGAGGYLFLWLDWYSGAWIGPIVALLEVFAVAWIYGMDRFSDDVKLMTGIHIPTVLRWATAFVAPVLVLVIFVTSCIDYVAPTYGDYQYSAWALSLGWGIVVLTLGPLIIHAVNVIARDSGSLLQRLRRNTNPLASWGPCEEESQAKYQVMMDNYNDRSWYQLLCFNLIGRYAAGKKVTLSNELTDINKI